MSDYTTIISKEQLLNDLEQEHERLVGARDTATDARAATLTQRIDMLTTCIGFVEKAPGMDTLLGYPIKALVLVADALQQQMVRPEDLAEWIRHVDTAYRYVNESFEADLRRTIHSPFGGTEYNATPESADGGEGE